MSTQSERRAEAEEDVRHRWRGFPIITGNILASVRNTFEGHIEPLKGLMLYEKTRVRKIYASHGCPIPE